LIKSGANVPITDLEGASSGPVLRTVDLARSFGGMRAVDGISLQLAPGEMLGIIGPNGAGKTTLFNLLAGSLRPSSGRIALRGRDVTFAPPDRRTSAGLGRTFQVPRPFAAMTVLENVLTGRRDQTGENLLANFLRPGRIAAEERQAVDKARELIDFVTLGPLEQQPARVLSGGQRKLLELARVLMADPAMILLDEPAAGVNPALLEVIVERIVALNRAGTAICLIEHNMDVIVRLCSRVIVMAGGRHLAEGAPEAVIQRPEVIEAYLGGVA
jgi:branched-chain amino acid transport system ATP-binding protein